ncbi:amidase domain-containing protein [Flexivirga endophytica]|nr:amidase domain-containing protein [Flexivirga endophytica]
MIVSGSGNNFSADVIVEETTRLYFDGVAQASDGTYTEYIATHEMAFIFAMGSWNVTSSTYLPADAYSFPITQFESAYASNMPQLVAAGLTGEDPDDPSDASLMPVYATQGYPSTQELIAKGTAGALVPAGIATDSLNLSYSAMASYCHSWWYRFNPSYPRFSEDCTNFISQALYYGGWPERHSGVWPLNRKYTSNWWCDGAGGFGATSYTWGGSNNLKNFMIYSGRVRWLGSIWSLGLGDCLAYDYDRNHAVDHWQMCTGHRNGKPLMSQHSGNTRKNAYYNKPLSEILSSSSRNRNSWFAAART